VPAGNLAKASLVGAKTVKGPSPLRASARSAARTAATKVEKSGLPAAMSTMVLEGSSVGTAVGLGAMVGAAGVAAGAQAASTSARTIIRLGKRNAFIFLFSYCFWFDTIFILIM